MKGAIGILARWLRRLVEGKESRGFSPFGAGMGMGTATAVLAIWLILAGAEARADSSLTVNGGAGAAGSKDPKATVPQGSKGDGTATVADLQEQVRRLQQSLALANADAEAFRRQWQDLRLRDQAIGVEMLTGDEKRLQNRVVEAVRELYQTEKERREAVNRLQQLLDSGREVLKGTTGIDLQKRNDYEVASRAAAEFLALRKEPGVPIAGDLGQMQVVHVNGDLGAVILNAGAELGVNPGMPFRIVRDGQTIGTVRAFEVREKVCAAVVETIASGKELKSGDRVAVAAQK
ncbi:hypothetical protein SAMN05444156_2922 [Verrucomicrobium sp. GAS474]|uniref:hypothetical protein n=1 Tax=Verrucomicrobium sp. GAS474 TaxID=1882831 RepID=UPI00087C05A8|nr:hypothetical protein [Verrucomicrobium sp. GAS474]SDU26111.1 hypothetical protein SAMN05444156_2922 [Verrucomicrobium sp. GAS474]